MSENGETAVAGIDETLQLLAHVASSLRVVEHAVSRLFDLHLHRVGTEANRLGVLGPDRQRLAVDAVVDHESFDHAEGRIVALGHSRHGEFVLAGIHLLLSFPGHIAGPPRVVQNTITGLTYDDLGRRFNHSAEKRLAVAFAPGSPDRRSPQLRGRPRIPSRTAPG